LVDGVWRGCDRGENLAPVAEQLSVVGEHTDRDAEHSRTQRTRAVVLWQPAVNDDEEVMRQVLGILGGRPQPSQRLPNIRKLRCVYRREVRRLARSHWRVLQHGLGRAGKSVMEMRRPGPRLRGTRVGASSTAPGLRPATRS